MDNKLTCMHRESHNKLQGGKRPDGWGNCSICTSAPENGNCKGHCPVRFFYVYVKDEEEGGPKE